MDIEQAKKLLNQDPQFKAAYEKVDLAYEIGKMIIDARIARDLTQYQLAEMVGTKQPSIARIESGNSLPSLTFLSKVAEALGTQLLPPKLEFLEVSRVNHQRVKDEQVTWNFIPNFKALIATFSSSEASTVIGEM